MTYVPIQKRIKHTSLYVFSKNPQNDLFTYSRPLALEESNAVAEAVNRAVKDEYDSAVGLKQGLSVAEKTVALYNMNTFKGILANRELTRQSNNALRFSTFAEGLLLHEAGMLPSGQMMDFGLVLYGIGSPNPELAQSLVEEAQKKNYTLPLMASFPSLGLGKGGKEYGVTPQLISEVGLVSGEDATNLLKKNNFCFGNSGVQRLDRDWNGGWGASWGNLDYFDAACRVGRVSGEASAKNLRDITAHEIKDNFDKEKRDLEEKLKEISEKEKAYIESAEAILSN